VKHLLSQVSDDWYASEASTRSGLVEELQRIVGRMRARPIRVLALATVLAVGLTVVVARHRTPVDAEIVLALTEGEMTTKHDAVPVEDLRNYVDGVLITDAKLGDLIERRNLFPLRRKLGMPFAIEQLRGEIDIAIWKNTFTYYDDANDHAEHSARIGITVSDVDGDRAIELAHDIAAIVIDTAQQRRQQVNEQLASDIAARRDGLIERLDRLTHSAAAKQAQLVRAHARREEGVAQALDLELVEIDHEQKSAENDLADIATSHDALADRIAAAGLDTSLAIVEEHRPERPAHRGFELAMVAVVLAVGSLFGSALLLGAFDSRVHDDEDVARLGLPVLGHVPGFAGDRAGSLAARGVSRARAPSFKRWRTPS
jgi:hypothetical protein